MTISDLIEIATTGTSAKERAADAAIQRHLIDCATKADRLRAERIAAKYSPALALAISTHEHRSA